MRRHRHRQPLIMPPAYFHYADAADFSHAFRRHDTSLIAAASCRIATLR
jgi:hypothetical protein